MTEVNTKYQFLLWLAYEDDDKVLLGCPHLEYNFRRKKDAMKEYINHDTYVCKMVMEYESDDPTADGSVLIEDWVEQ